MGRTRRWGRRSGGRGAWGSSRWGRARGPCAPAEERAARVIFLWAAAALSSATWSFGGTVADLVSGWGFWLYHLTAIGVWILFWAAGLNFGLVFPAPRAAVVRRPWLVALVYLAA